MGRKDTHVERSGGGSFVAAVGDLEAYVDALLAWQAGAIEVAGHEDPGVVHLMLRRAASLLGVEVRTGWAPLPAGAPQLYWVLDP